MNTKLKREEEEESSLEEDSNINTAARSILIHSCTQSQIPTADRTASASLKLRSVKLNQISGGVTCFTLLTRPQARLFQAAVSANQLTTN